MLSSLQTIRARAGLWLFQWKERHQWHVITPRENTPAGFAVAGTTKRVAFFTRHYLDENSTSRIKIASSWSFWRCEQNARRLAHQFGLVVFSTKIVPPSLRSDLLPLDLFIPLVIPLTGSIEAYTRSLGSLAKANLRKVRSRGYRVEISNDASWAREFYERYHRPSIQGRHGDDGFLSSPEDIAGLLHYNTFEWLRVFDGEVCISACIGERRNNEYYLHRTGWRDGSPALQAAGAGAALYWFGVQRALELGLSAFNQGGVMPCLENGLFIHKTAWGGRLPSGEHPYNTRFLLLDPAHPDARRFLSAHSLLIRDTDQRFIVISSHLPAEVPAYGAHAPHIAAWFRLRNTPDPGLLTAHRLLPASLRPWFDAIPLTPPPVA